MSISKPHGGRLVNREVKPHGRRKWESVLKNAPRLRLTPREKSDLELIAIGGLSPLEGFMGPEDYESVLETMRLASGLPWTLPVALAATKQEAFSVESGEPVALADDEGKIFGMLETECRFPYDKKREAEKVYGTRDEQHPGVKRLYAQKDFYLGGRVRLFEKFPHGAFDDCAFTPAEARERFEALGWRRVVGFQTRNPVHRAHEYIHKCALEITDGLFLHPLVGETKSDDIPAETRLACYRALIERYYPKGRVVLGAFVAAMRYAGPREAIFHAMARKNFGCTHFIVGRDHAGVGSFYDPFAAHRIFDEFSPDEIGITPLFFDFTFYCRKCGGVISAKTCPHGEAEWLRLSGTRVREMLSRGEEIPPEFTRPEVAKVLRRHYAREKGDSAETTKAG